jgi:hypothetical protein
VDKQFARRQLPRARDNIANFNAEGDEIGHVPRQVALGVDS